MMRLRMTVAGFLFALGCSRAPAPSLVDKGLVDNVRASIAKNDLAGAERQIQAFQQALGDKDHGDTPEVAAALSWMARGAVSTKDFDRAETYADRARRIVLQSLPGRKLDQDPFLPVALGNTIEAHVQVLKSRGEIAEALESLRQDLDTFAATSLHDKIQKNIHLLSLEGKPAPALEAGVWFGPRPPALSSLRGKAVLLFFWAHWCPDCKATVPIIASLMKKYGPQGLALIGPTRYYGYVANGKDAPPEVEKPYIDQVRREYYAPLADMPAPLSNANFARYGASSTPTLALVDRQGMIAWYHPGTATEQDLASHIEQALR